MSWQATRLVVLYGPDDNQLYRLCNTVAEAASPNGRNARLGQRLLADRCRVSHHRLRDLMDLAIETGWLDLQDIGEGTAPSVYCLGERFTEAQQRAAASASSARSDGLARPIGRAARVSERKRARTARVSERAAGSRTVLPIRSKRTVAARTAQGGGSVVRSGPDGPPQAPPLRANGTNPRALGTNPRGPKPPPVNPYAGFADWSSGPVDQSSESVDHDGVRCVVSAAALETARAALHSKERPL
jgi:hypothetical protein